ncbi:MAG: hypothetical protein WAK93_13755 [Solirubrobacteraceae bacterium]
MTLSTFGAAALVAIASVLIGRALDLMGIRCGSAGPAVGLSVQIIVAGIAIKLPGGSDTGAIVIALIVLSALAIVVARERRRSIREVGPLMAALLAGFGSAIPFIANGRIGLLGVGLDNDTSSHLLWAAELVSPGTVARYGGSNGYPMGPHSFVDTLTSGLGIRADLSFTVLLIAGVLVTAIVAARALRDAPIVVQAVGGALASLLYLVAAYYAEGAFKEQLLALFLLAAVVGLEEARSNWSRGVDRRWSLLCPIAVLVAAAVYVYSYPGISWFVLTAVVWLGAEVAVRREAKLWKLRARRAVRPVGVAAIVFVLLVLPMLSQTLRFEREVGASPAATGAIAASNLGNLAHPLSAYEALGVWNSADFRFAPGGSLHVVLSLLALGALLLGLGSSLSRRQLVVPSAIAACAILYAFADHGQSPYVAAKALVIAGPLVAVTQLRGLAIAATGRRSAAWRLASITGTLALVIFASYSSFQALRNEPVWPNEPTAELLSLARLTRGQTVMFLGNSDYAAWLFHDSAMSTTSPTSASAGRIFANPGKPFALGESADVDNLETASLIAYRWLVTSNTSDMSQPPVGFHLVRRLQMYDLWRRTGPVTARESVDTPGTPGAMIACHTRAGRLFSRQHGVAAVMVAPVRSTLAPLRPGQSEHVAMPLATGTWQLSLQYTSAVPIAITAGGRSWRMSPYLDRLGPVFAVGSVSATSGTPVLVRLTASRPSLLTGASLGADATYLVATRDSYQRLMVPLARTCGRYVDWYRH